MSQGTRLQRAWADLRKGGGLAPSPDAIRNYLEEDCSVMLTTEDVKSRISSYFSGLVDASVDDETGETVYTWREAPTKSGLAVSLGITRHTLQHYCSGITSSGKPLSDNESAIRRISNTDIPLVCRAVDLIESYYETCLTNGKNPTGSIFWLLNRDSERWTNDHTKNVVIEHRTSGRLTADEIAKKHGLSIVDADCREVPQPSFLQSDGGCQNEQQED